MKNIIKLLTAASLAALLAGCSSAESAKTPAPEYSYEFLENEQQFLDDLRASGSTEVDKRSDIKLIEAGYTVCDVLNKDGVHDEEAIAAAADFLDKDVDADAAVTWVDVIVTTAILRICPEHKYLLDM